MVPPILANNMNIADELVQIAGDEPPVLLGHDAITTTRQVTKTVEKFIGAMQHGLGRLGSL